MGFGISSFKKLFKPKNLLTASILGPTAGLIGMSDVGQQVGKGMANLATGGMLMQQEATDEAKKSRDQAAKQYAAETAAAQETARKIAETEEERKRRLALAGTQMPSTLSGTYLGYPRGSQSKSLLG